ncbi:hypothetical protein BU26DRAFT_595386 [Trematosphaeria pertusa]|uniref:Uncharacterized protein n=1 Tax=Trematosphaeria pertusa TaxID=390896 RepID=A0A6A6IIV3_9PLEO|nr:uncharacterized protein BU26DRAFT_595386 [Trematosphaeria pertusa]KAF2249500.1 hypothetical protein BU26DRAFT_595386 [Trematosphaeria pertusa]
MVPPKTADFSEQYVADIRELPYVERQALKAGPKVKIFDDNTFIMELPRALFLAATTEPRLITSSGEIHLPPDTGVDGIISVGCWLLAVVDSEETFHLRPKKDMADDLRICRAGRLLGMEKYIDHIHRHYWWKFYNKPFSAADVDLVVGLAMDPKDPFLRLVSERLAAYLRDGQIMNPDALRAYIKQNPMLDNTVRQANKEFKKKKLKEKDKAERAAARAEREALLIAQRKEEEARREEEDRQKKQEQARKAAEQAKLKAEIEARRKKLEDEYREKKQKEQALWAERNKKDAELNRSLQDKIRSGKKTVTREEARYFERTRGKRCPYNVV